MSLKLPDVPNLANPGLYQLLLALRQQMVTLARQFDDVSAQVEMLAPQFDNDTSLATTAFVQRALGNRSGLQGFGINTNLTADVAGQLIVGGAPNIVLTLPKINTMVDGAEIAFYADAANVTVGVAGGDVITGGLASYVLNLGDTLTLVAKVAINQWYPQSGSAQLPNAAQMKNWPLAAMFDRSGKLATTQFVMRALGNFNGVGNISGPFTFTSDYAGWYVQLYPGAGPILPKVSTMPVGQTITFQNALGGAGAATFTAAAGDIIFNPVTGANVGTFSLPAGKYMTFISGGGTQWYVTGTGA